MKAQEVQIMDVNSLAHTKWECKYHIVFAPKYRRQIIYKAIRADVGEILGSLCRRKGIEIIEAECCPDHIHMLQADTIITTGLAGGLLTPYKGLLPALESKDSSNGSPAATSFTY